MKKISIAFILIMLFSMSFVKVNAKEVQPYEIKNLNVEISGMNKSVVELYFETSEPLLNLEIDFCSDIGGSTYEIVYEYNRENEFCKSICTPGTFLENGNYAYHFEILSQSGKIGTFDIRIKYLKEDVKVVQSIYVTNGNPNVSKDVYNPRNALVIGIIASLICGICTFTIIKLSEKNIQMRDEEENS